MIKFKKDRKNKTGARRPRYWILSTGIMGVLVAFTVGNSRDVMVAYASERDGRLEIVQKAKQQGIEFNIPAGRLEDVIKVFQTLTGTQIKIEKTEIFDVRSNGVVGTFTIEQALIRILEGTGVSYSFRDPKTVLFELKAQAATVEIKDEEAQEISSPKYTEPLRDTPQTINIIDKETIEQQGATTLRDVLRNVPGLTINAGEGGAVGGDNLTLRGFSARNDIYVDGARDLSPQVRDPFNVEQVEVVKGPSSATTGRGSTGGTVNLVTKIPNLRPTYNFDLTGGTDKTKRVTGDINIPLERLKLGTNNAFRLNFVGHDSNYAGREDVRNSRYGIAPTLLLGLSRNTSLTLGYFFLGQENIQDYGIPFVPVTNNVLVNFRDRIAPVPRDKFYGYLNRDKEYLRSNLATITLNHVFNDRMNLRNQFRYDHSSRDANATPPRFNNNNSGTLINRELRAWSTTDQNYDNQTDFTARFNTGFVKHSIVTGAEFIHENSRRFNRTAANALTNLFNPNPRDTYPGIIYTNPLPALVKANTQAIYAFDTIELHPKFELSGGLRYERYSAQGDLLPTITLPTATAPVIFGTTRARVDKTDNLFNVRLAAVYKPFQTGTFYASYGTSSNPSISGLIYENATTTNLDPERTRTFEVGTKWDLFDNRLLATAAIFNVEKTNARTPNLDNTTLQVLAGRQRVNGIELGITGNVTNRWNVLAGYTLLDSRIVESNTFVLVNNVRVFTELGRRFINTPRNSFNLWSTYRLPFNLTVGGGARFTDLRYVNTTNTRFVDGFWLYEATASYQLTKNIDIRLNGYNLGNKYYFDRFSGGHAVPGPGRSLLVSTGFRF